MWSSAQWVKMQIQGQQWMVTRGSYIHGDIIGAPPPPPQLIFPLQISQNIDGFRQNNSRGF